MSGGDPLFLWLLVLAADGLFAGLPGLRTVLAAPLALVARLAGGMGRIGVRTIALALIAKSVSQMPY